MLGNLTTGVVHTAYFKLEYEIGHIAFDHTHRRVLVICKYSCDDCSFLCIGRHHALIQVLAKDGREVIHVLKKK